MIMNKVKQLGKVLFTFYASVLIGMSTVVGINIMISDANAQQTTRPSTSIQQAAGNTTTLGPFRRFAIALLDIFHSTRNMLYILAGFSILWWAYKAATDGKIDLTTVVYIITALAIMAGVGYILEGVVNRGDGGNNAQFIPASTV